MSGVKGFELIKKLDEFAPPYLAEKGDPVGLAVGTLDKTVRRVMVTLDVRPEVVEEAIEKEIDLIVAHHPPIFRPLKNLVTTNPQNQMYANLLKNDIAVYAAHTNLDVATNGMNAWLADAIGLKSTEILEVTKQEKYKEIIIFVPEDHAEEVRKAVMSTGAGQIGPNYKDVSYTLEGTGRFTPINDAEPAIGELNETEAVREVRIEIVFPERLTPAVEKALFDAHPYEEPSYDILSIENFIDQYGLGRVGELEEAVTVSEFAQTVKEAFGVAGLRYVTDDETKFIQRVAICGGDGGKFFPSAIKKGADVYITGDVYYHTAHDMLAEGLTVIDPGHHIESICKEKLQTLFQEWAEESDWQIDILQSEINTDPYRFL